MKSAFIFLADGFEDMEALGTLDVLRRGGIDAVTVSVGESDWVQSAHGVCVQADIPFDQFIQQTPNKDSALVFPGGMPGAANLAATEPLMEVMKAHFAESGLVAAICAAPGLVATQLPGIKGRKATCYDGFEPYLEEKGVVYTGESVVTDGNLITGRGPGFAIDFGLAILAYLSGGEKALDVQRGLLLA